MKGGHEGRKEGRCSQKVQQSRYQMEWIVRKEVRKEGAHQKCKSRCQLWMERKEASKEGRCTPKVQKDGVKEIEGEREREGKMRLAHEWVVVAWEGQSNQWEVLRGSWIQVKVYNTISTFWRFPLFKKHYIKWEKFQSSNICAQDIHSFIHSLGTRRETSGW